MSVREFVHDRLMPGRYGDPFNPWGDLMSVGRAWCVTKPNGKLLNAVPYEDEGDRVVYNAHRVYGPRR
jgi:hypothetical protein